MGEQSGLFHEAWQNGEYRPRVHAYYFKEWTINRMDPHTHDSTEIMYVMNGECLVAIDGGNGRESVHPLRKGDFIVLNANIRHRLRVDRACRMLNVEFDLADADGVVPPLRRLAREDAALDALLRAPGPSVTLTDPDEVLHALKSLVLELDLRGDGGALAQLLLAQVLFRIARLLAESREAGLPQADLYVKQAIAYMQENYDRDIKLQDIAGAANLHPSYLQRLFKRQVGQPVTAYLTAHRMERAKMLLSHTDIPIADISEYVGVASRSYFHALFKKHAGMTPVEYRSAQDRHRWNTNEKL
ncbi:AraC family transcriptional regulator [Cohnella sp. JJ-181]|uniref:AraC family transcriptional regulator n=1 Tax=Cohnella rhizoplanae TaxID=2974897 RepID=UPI0022FFA360|nr:AraC family transcriptional regulator [Cohnella sp. JJ-181]CAI6079250.1 HTH-type transcriptional activator RhaR [Cohnella sp. JJ-181]